MAKWRFDGSAGRDYPGLGFVAEPGAILDAVSAPDALWSAASGDPAETVTRYGAGGSVPAAFTEPVDGAALVYDTVENRFKPTDTALSDTYVAWTNVKAFGAKGDGVTDDTAAIQAALDAVNTAGGGTAYLPVGTYIVSATLTVGSNTTLTGSGRTASILKLKSGANTHVLTNKDQTNGNPNVTLRDFGIDGNKANQTQTDPPLYGIKLHRCTYLSLQNVEGNYMKGTGIFLTGDAQVSRVVALHNVTAHDNTLDGVWVGNAMRMVSYQNVVGKDNGRHGVVLDHSEANANGVYGHGNGEYGIWIRNVFGCTYSNLAAALNGHHGIYVIGMTYSLGTAWRAQHNGQLLTGQSDIYFDGGVTVPGYGVTQASTVSGVLAGGANQYGGPKKTDYGIYVADGVSELKLLGVHYGDSGLLDNSRIPASPGNLVLQDTALSTAHLRMRAGNEFIRGGFMRIQAFTTGTRPSAASAGSGAQIYDSTIGKPIYSDGTVWRDSAGTAV